MLHMPTAPRPLPLPRPSIKPTKIIITAPTSTTPTNQGYRSRRRHDHLCCGRLPTTPIKKRRNKSAESPSVLARSSPTAASVTNITAATSFQPCPYRLLFALSRSISMFLEGSAPNHGTFDAKGKSDRSVFGRWHAQGGIGSQSENGDNVYCRGSRW